MSARCRPFGKLTKIVTNPYAWDKPETTLPTDTVLRFAFGPEWSDYVEVQAGKEAGTLEVRIGDAQLAFEPLSSNVGRIRLRRW